METREVRKKTAESKVPCSKTQLNYSNMSKLIFFYQKVTKDILEY